MCRWFAYIAPDEECLLEDVLVVPRHALSKQVHEHYLPNLISHVPGEETSQAEIRRRNMFNNVDGFGLAWYTLAKEEFNQAKGPHPVLYKHEQPPTNDANFHSICANTSSTNVMAHIRSATATPVVAINNHPFVFGRHTIMHNGVVASFVDIRREMLGMIEKQAYENIHGSTDSEHLAALYVTFLTKNSTAPGRKRWEVQYSTAEMKQALQDTFHAIIKLQLKILGREKAEASSLNVCCSDGEQMIAFRFRNHKVEQPPSLYWSTTAGVTMNRKYPDHPDGLDNNSECKPAKDHGVHVIVASEPTTYKKKEWNLVEKNHAVIVGKDGKHVSEPVDVPEELQATAKTTQHG